MKLTLGICFLFLFFIVWPYVQYLQRRIAILEREMFYTRRRLVLIELSALSKELRDHLEPQDERFNAVIRDMECDVYPFPLNLIAGRRFKSMTERFKEYKQANAERDPSSEPGSAS